VVLAEQLSSKRATGLVDGVRHESTRFEPQVTWSETGTETL
jgi:hypothetical protein